MRQFVSDEELEGGDDEFSPLEDRSYYSRIATDKALPGEFAGDLGLKLQIEH